LDEHISSHLAAGLRRRKIDATTSTEVNLNGASDAAHLSFALSTGRVILTQDDDFLRLHAQGSPHAGILYCRQHTLTLGELLRRVISVHDLLSPEEMAGRIEFL
jgi:predicted nuclease of predicted toxin-antitoxin system